MREHTVSETLLVLLYTVSTPVLYVTRADVVVGLAGDCRLRLLGN